MNFKPENTFDAEQRIWCGMPDREYFSSNQSLGEIIFREMKRHPKLTAQISDTENTVLTKEELLLNSMRVASFMRALGMSQSDIVGIIGRNTTHLCSVVYGCFFNGIAFHALNIILEESDIKIHFGITKPRLIFCDGEAYERVKSAMANLNVKIVTLRSHHMDSISIETVLATPVLGDFKPFRLEKGKDQTLAILCSSGTTGTPKAVIITNSQMILNFSTYLEIDDVQYTANTIDWISGLGTVITSGVFSTTLIIDDIPYDPANFLRLIEQYKVTWLFHSPTMMAMMVNCNEFEKANLNSIQYFLYGGGMCSEALQNRIRSHLRSDCLHNVYGLTETCGISMNWNCDKKPKSVGRLMQDVKLILINEQCERLGPNEIGEICIQNGQNWPGYYGNPEETQIFRDSNQWLHTGDLGYMDNDGFLYKVDRKKDMLRCPDGLMYYPSEIEEVITQMPDVAEVCVFGVWDPVNDDEATAAVVKKVGSQLRAEDVVDYVKQHMASYMQLHGGAIIVDDLKRSPNGKVNRRATKDYFLDIKNKNKSIY